MARYIDADLLLAEIEDNTPLNFTDSESEVQAQFDFQVFKHMVGYQPTADVVPREACVDMHRAICKIQACIRTKYHSVSDLAIIDDYYKGQTVLLLMLEGFIANLVKEYEVNGSLHLDENEKPKSDVVREVFAEIDQLIAAYLNSPHYSIGEIAYDIEELKKKYMEGKTDA